MSKNLPVNKQLRPYIALLTATAIWGGAGPVIKLTLESIPPFTFLMYRFIIVCILVLPIMVYELKKHHINSHDLKNLIWLGIFGQTSIGLVFLALNFTTALDSSIIETAGPLLVIAGGHYFFNEKINRRVKFGVLLAIAGTIIVAAYPALMQASLEKAEARLFGNMMSFTYTFCSATFVIMSKVVMGKKSVNMSSLFHKLHIRPMINSYSPILHTSLSFYVGLVTILPLVVLENMGFFGYAAFDPMKLTNGTIMGILYMALFSSIVAYYSFEWGLKRTEASESAIFGYLTPLFTLPFAYLLISEVPSRANMLGAAVIAVGVYIAEKHKKQRVQ